MRGGIDSYDPSSGSGVIFGDDGIRYAFAREVVRDFDEVSVGIPVIFDHDGTNVTDAMPRPGWTASMPRVRYEDLDEARGLGPFSYYLKCLILYFDSTGRAQRVEFWSFHAVNFSMFFVLQLATVFIGVAPTFGQSPFWLGATGLLIFTVVPTITLAARRVHDVGFSRAFLLIFLLPFIGWIILFVVLWFAPSQRHSNSYGPHPKAVRATA